MLAAFYLPFNVQGFRTGLLTSPESTTTAKGGGLWPVHRAPDAPHQTTHLLPVDGVISHQHDLFLRYERSSRYITTVLDGGLSR